ncbi:hypothetical protein FQN57_005317 [Myotisia sp. PD_48]|nr:hypothetical protein FQN57_005317 [Myotisia sp. PD_48]
MALSSLNLRALVAKIRWSNPKRLYLCIIVRCFMTDWKKFACTFNHLFADDLQAQGFPDGTDFRRLYSQWRDMQKHRHPIYLEVAAEPTSYAIHVLQIQKACRSLDLHLAPQDNVNIGGLVAEAKQLCPEYIKIIRMKGRELIQPDPVITSNLPFVQPDPIETPRTLHTDPVPTPSVYRNLPPATELQLSRQGNIPPLLFRAWNHESNGLNSSTCFAGGLWATCPPPQLSAIEPGIICRLTFC